MASRYYNVECRFTNRAWEHLEQFRTLAKAMTFIRTMNSHKYPLRVIRVVKTKIFEEQV